MADEVITAAPVEAAPVVADVAPVVTEAAPVAVETSPAPEAASEAAPLLAPVEEAAPVEVSETPVETAEAEPAPLPVYEFKLPEGEQTDSAVFKAFQSKLGEFQNLFKAEQAAVQTFGQEMIDMHMEAVKGLAESQNKSAWDWFNNRNKEWLETSKKDPVIGGEGFNQTVSAASQAISLYGGTKAQQIETAKLLHETGVENHPALLRFLSNITKQAAKEGTPVSTTNVPVQKQGIAQAMYGKSSNAS